MNENQQRNSMTLTLMWCAESKWIDRKSARLVEQMVGVPTAVCARQPRLLVFGERLPTQTINQLQRSARGYFVASRIVYWRPNQSLSLDPPDEIVAKEMIEASPEQRTVTA